jgi:hypothetical protein
LIGLENLLSRRQPAPGSSQCQVGLEPPFLRRDPDSFQLLLQGCVQVPERLVMAEAEPDDPGTAGGGKGADPSGFYLERRE